MPPELYTLFTSRLDEIYSQLSFFVGTALESGNGVTVAHCSAPSLYPESIFFGATSATARSLLSAGTVLFRCTMFSEASTVKGDTVAAASGEWRAAGRQGKGKSRSSKR